MCFNIINIANGLPQINAEVNLTIESGPKINTNIGQIYIHGQGVVYPFDAYVFTEDFTKIINSLNLNNRFDIVYDKFRNILRITIDGYIELPIYERIEKSIKVLLKYTGKHKTIPEVSLYLSYDNIG